MAGVNDPVFRAICKRLGAGLTYTEMVSAKGLQYGSAKTADMLFMFDEEAPAAVQLFGRDPAAMAAQAAELEQRYGERLALIDINMGCPARKVAGKGDGAALLREPELAAAVMRSVAAAVQLPVTVKLRKGYAAGEDVAVRFAVMAEDCGIAAVAVHGRTAEQLYHGHADRECIARVKQAVSIPVIASGDVFCAADIAEYREQHGADAVMAARGAQGNPWIFAGLRPDLEQRVRIAHEHTVRLAELNPHRLPSMRKHIAWYFKGTPHAAAIRRAVNDCQCLRDYEALFEQILAWRS